MTKVKVYCMYGLGGSWWSEGMETVLAASLRKIPGVEVPATIGFTQWRSIVEDIKKQPKTTKIVVAGHSMGAGAATYVTDQVHVDMVACYDCAGQAPSGITKNCDKLYDFWDKGFDINPNFRPWAYKGHEQKITQVVTYYGHTYADNAPDLAAIVVNAVKKLAQ